MSIFRLTGSFTPTIKLTAMVEPFDVSIGDQFGFILLENGDFLLQQNGDRFLLEGTVVPLTADTTVYTADNTAITADRTFILNTG